MKTDSKQLLILFTITIIASGCASNTNTQDSTSSSSPIEVNSFDAIPNPVPSGQPINLNMELENTGGQDAQPAAARVFGPNYINQESKESRTKVFSGGLLAPNENRPSVPKTATWSLPSPSLGENREIDSTIYSKIFYNYQTRADTDFKLVSASRLRDQGYTQSDATLENTDGPIQLDIRGTTPKIFYEEGSGSNTGEVNSQVCIIAKNDGEGQAFLGGDNVEGMEFNMKGDDATEDAVELSIEKVEGVTLDAKGDDVSGRTVTLDLINGNRGYQCFNMEASSLTNSETNINLRVSADYNYVKETSTEITVEGRRGSANNNNNDGDSDSWRWTGSESQKNSQMSNYDVSSVDALCENLVEEEALAADNCESE